MVVISYAGKEANAKIVYYGPGLGGKTTNLEFIYDSVPSSSRGKMVSMRTQTDRTLFFDFLPLDLGELGGFKTRFLLYTVPGQVFYNATRKLVLRGVDAIAFIADSQTGKMDENRESLANLEENLAEYDLSLDAIPFVFQYNKRDLPETYTVEELNRELNPRNVPYFEAIATEGVGVFETFRGLSKLLLERLSQEIGHRLVFARHIGPQRETHGRVKGEETLADASSEGIEEEVLPEDAIEQEARSQPEDIAQATELVRSREPAVWDTPQEEGRDRVPELTEATLEELDSVPEGTALEASREGVPAPTLQARDIEVSHEDKVVPAFFDRAVAQEIPGLERESALFSQTPEPTQAGVPAQEPGPETEQRPTESHREAVAAEPQREVEANLQAQDDTAGLRATAGVDAAEGGRGVEAPSGRPRDVWTPPHEETPTEGIHDVSPRSSGEELEEEEPSFVTILRRNNVGVFQRDDSRDDVKTRPEPSACLTTTAQESPTIETTIEVPVIVKPGEVTEETILLIRLRLKPVIEEARTPQHEFLLEGVSR